MSRPNPNSVTSVTLLITSWLFLLAVRGSSSQLHPSHLNQWYRLVRSGAPGLDMSSLSLNIQYEQWTTATVVSCETVNPVVNIYSGEEQDLRQEQGHSSVLSSRLLKDTELRRRSSGGEAPASSDTNTAIAQRHTGAANCCPLNL